jgi:hypothetical protein
VLNRPYFLSFFSLALAILFSSCDKGPCLSGPVTQVGFEFYGTGPDTQSVKPVSFDSLFLRQKGKLYDRLGSKKVSNAAGLRVIFPSGSEGFWFGLIHPEGRDSVFLSLRKTVLFAGESCGFYYGFERLKIDSVGGRFKGAEILNSVGDSSKKVHVRIHW